MTVAHTTTAVAEPGPSLTAATSPGTCPVTRSAVPQPTTMPELTVDITGEAREFLEMFSAETGRPISDRWAQVRAEIAATGTWWQTPEELSATREN